MKTGTRIDIGDVMEPSTSPRTERQPRPMAPSAGDLDAHRTDDEWAQAHDGTELHPPEPPPHRV
ncbi:hypothetical protein JTF08_03475 [Micrococcaceae bacterium RIT802]|nr:hypothetical protein [Micrococcaceae bacterium RIT 802]